MRSAADVREAGHRRPLDVEVAAEHERRVARPTRRGRRRDATTSPQPARTASTCSRAGSRTTLVVLDAHDPRARRGAPAAAQAAVARARDPSEPAHEDRVAAAAVRLDQLRPPSCDRLSQRQQLVARGERGACLGVARARQRRGPPRRHLLQQCDVPLPCGKSLANASIRSWSRGGTARPWKRFHVNTRSDIVRPYTCPLATPPAHRRRADQRRAARADRARDRAEGRAARPRARSPASTSG